MKQFNQDYLSNGQVIKGYQIQTCLGKGQFGQVFKALKFDNHELVAIKVIQRKRFSENDGVLGHLVQSEIKALELIKSDHVVGYVETFSDEEYCYIVMEYCNSGDLDQQLKNPNLKLTEQDAIGIIKQILKGLRDLHQKFIIHRDLKIQNIMIHNNSIYKIADLGFCKLLQNADQKSMLQLGTLFTMAPEIFNQNQYGLSSDMFSVGVIFYQILYDRFPIKQRDYLSTNQPNINFEKNKIEVSDLTKDLLLKMLQFDPKTRISFKDLIDHPAFDKPIFSLISRIQLRANVIPFDDYSNFYKEQSKMIESNQQNIMNQLPMQSIIKEEQKSQSHIKIFEISEIKYNNEENKLSLEIEEINKKINEMYYFSNTFQEVIQILQQPHIMDMLCIKIQQLCVIILKMITENIEKYKNQKQCQADYILLQEQFRELDSFSELISYYLQDIKEQLMQFSEKSQSEFILNHQDPEQQFNQIFSQLLNNQILRGDKNINYAFAHVIQCYLFCKTKNPEFIQFDETTFNLNRSLQLHPNSIQLLDKFQANSSPMFNQDF